MNKELLAILLKIQRQLPVIERTTEAFKYKYAPIDEVWAKIGKIINDNGFVIVNEITAEGVTTKAIHELGEITSFIRFSNLDLAPQDRGSEITYYRRYNLTSIFNVIIVDEDDDATVTKVHDPIMQATAQATSEIYGNCPKCGAPMKYYKNGKLGCSKYCWMNKTPQPHEDQIGGV